MPRTQALARSPRLLIRFAFVAFATTPPAVAITAPAARAQTAIALATLVTDPALTAGMTLRVTQGPRRLAGRLTDARGDTLRLATGPLGTLRVRVPLTAGSRVEHRIGPASRWRGAARGAAIGVAAGLFIGIVIVDAFHGDVGDVGPVSGYFLPSTIAAGAVVGLVVPGSRWGPVRLAPKP